MIESARPRPALAFVAVVLLLCAVTAWLHADVLRHGGAGVFRQTPLHLERSDQLLHAWTLDWIYHQLPRNPLRLFNANAFYPHPYSLALSDHLFGVAMTLVPIRAFVEDPLRLNAFGTLATFVLAGAAMAALVWSLTGSMTAACVAGLLYAGNPFRAHNYAQIQILSDYGIPLSFLFLHRYERRGRAADLMAVAATAAWQTLCSAYLGAYLTVALGLVLLDRLRRRPPRRRDWLGLAAGAITFGAMVGPFMYPYAWLRAHGQLHQHELNSIALSLGVEDLFCWRGCESFFGPVLVPTAVLLAAVALWPRGRAPAGTYAAVSIIGAGLALGPYIHLSSISDEAAAPGFLFPGPYWLLQRYAPGFDGLRAPARAIVLTHFAFAALAGLGAGRILTASRPALRPLTSAILLGATLLTLDRPGVTFEPLPASSDVPEVHRWLATQPSEQPIVELPISLYDAQIMYQSRAHWRPIVNGYSGFLPFGTRYIVASLRCYPCPSALRTLAELDVRTHLVNVGLLPPAQRAAMEHRLDAAPSLTETRRFGDTRVMVLSPRDEMPVPAETPLAALDRGDWRASSSRGPRGVELALDGSLETAWSTAIDLSNLQHPVAGTRLLRQTTSWKEFMQLIPRGHEWFALDLGRVHDLRRLSVAFMDLLGPPAPPAPTIQASLDGVHWVDLPSDAIVRPSVRDLDRDPTTARLHYDWPGVRARHLRLAHRGYWYLRDVAVFE